jgi:serine-type D-Ala-D-Ala carboxypeptidase (penicillin-binding protein 5/6)
MLYAGIFDCYPRAVARHAIVWLAIGCFCSLFLGQFADAAQFKSQAKQAILIDYDTGAILYQKNADDLVPPASMSKLATLAVVFDRLQRGILSMDDTFIVSEHAWRTGGAPSGTSAMFAPLGKPVTLNDLVQGIAIQSGNDASIVVAEGIAGNEAQFAKMMTDYVRGIGLKKSTFANPTGLPDPGHLMTAREIAFLAQHLIKKYPEYYKFFGERRFPYQPKGRRRPYAFFNRNPLLSAGVGADGLKTGHIKAAGYGLVASTVRDGRRLIGVVHGLNSAKARKNEAIKLINWGYRNFSTYDLYEADEVVGSARVWGGEKFYVPLKGDGAIKVILPKSPVRQRLTAEIVYNAPLKPPVKKGDQVAVLRVTSTNNAVNNVPLYAAEDVEEGSVVRRGLDSLVVMAWRWMADQASDLLKKI